MLKMKTPLRELVDEWKAHLLAMAAEKNDEKRSLRAEQFGTRRRAQERELAKQFGALNGWDFLSDWEEPDPFTPHDIGKTKRSLWRRCRSRGMMPFWSEHALFFRQGRRFIAFVGQPFDYDGRDLEHHAGELDPFVRELGLVWTVPPDPHASIYFPGEHLFIVVTLPGHAVKWLPEQIVGLGNAA